MALHVLTAQQVMAAKPGSKLSDGGGLRLDVDPRGGCAWILRFKSPVTGKERYMGLGSADRRTLADARKSLAAARLAAVEARKVLQAGTDPLLQRDAEREVKRAAAKAATARSTTFKLYAERYITGKEGGWKNDKHRQQWRNSLRDHAYPIIGDLAVCDVDTDSVLKVLRPIWTTIPETARRVRGRIEMILSAAKTEGLRTGENPALWRGHLDQMELARRKKSSVKHHPALPYEEMPACWQSLSADVSDTARMLRWIILTACRFNEARDMESGEVKGDLWTIPEIRMKAEREHRVPLTKLALEQLPFRPVSDVTLAKCIRRHTESPATTHGFRSTFRDWAGDMTNFPRDIAEMALAHEVGDDTEVAYRRSTALAKRRELMEQWAAYCAGGAVTG